MTISDCLNLVHADLCKIEYYTGEIKSGIEDNELSIEDVLNRLLPLKMFVDSLFQGVEEYTSDPRLIAEEEKNEVEDGSPYC